METVDWNAEITERLQTLYRDGLSFTRIAEDIGVTRNAAIGKAHRLKLEKRDSPIGKPGPKTCDQPRKIRTARRLERRFAPPEPAVIECLSDDHDYRCEINQLTDCSCRYPLWGRDTPHPERLYCGRPGADLYAGVPYCRCHTLLCAN
jgi:hypothetical protein